MTTKTSMRTPLSRVRGLGSAKDGTAHFWWQRVTGLANIFLTVALVAIALGLAGASYDEARAGLANPLAAIVVLLFILSATYHMRLGMQVIVEDYVQGELAKVLLLAFNTLFSIAIAVACVFAVLKISFGG